MNTAKNFQLLDDNNNNISPITNIESLYYEVNEGGVKLYVEISNL